MQPLAALLSSDTRLYALAWKDGGGPELAVEAWWGSEELCAGFEYCLDLLSPDARLELKTFLGRAVALDTRLSDGGTHRRSGYVRTAAKLGSDGGCTRYRLTVVPWLWLLSRGRHHRVFQEKSLVAIVELVFADTRPRSYCVQYNESDYVFISRLLAEEGLGWRVEADDAAAGGHRVVIFADSRGLPEDILSQSASGGRGIRYHRADS